MNKVVQGLDDGGPDLTGEPRYIHIRQLNKTYSGPREKVAVLKDLDLDVAQGETVAVVGASGVGKSTLLHIVGTLDRPTSGQVMVGGRDVFAMDEPALAAFRNQQIGFVFQFHHLLPEFSALENVMMPALIARRERGWAQEKALELLEEVGVAQRSTHRVGELSGGEAQRVAVARALVLGPSLLLADEPTGNLDERTGEKVHQLLVRLNQTHGLTTLVATHNERLASALTRRVRLADGKAHCDEQAGPSEE
ncbi:MAG: ABC transporter ATP-binding protein [Desulfarculaceae bacterium]|nr:ABC transporter ATP-binding protein [Desulfarculaceae bacterium]MCF8072237.1 ABC transporter ATP-binding protein [Desulfarculaceae bacterium]MCF8100158.1 ABC transporter ATP-binding protein [Desulfarculaceae bacterium]MCF8117899.1 ABC transporter ATP-binding protein [Desulfarculaceae bacterium]